MKPAQHVMISAGVAAGLWVWSRSIPAVAGCMIGGVLVDIDHHLDYWVVKKKFPFSYKDLSNYFFNLRSGKVYLIFHSWELLFICWGIFSLFQLDIFWYGVLVGVSFHLLCDEVFNPLKPLGYFMFYRIKHGFDFTRLAKDEYVKCPH